MTESLGHYHLQSLAFAMVCVTSLTLLCLAFSVRRLQASFAAPLRAWILGTGLVVLADILFVVTPHHFHMQWILTIVVGVGCTEWLHALRIFAGRMKRVWWPYPLMVAAGASSFFIQDFHLNTAITSAVLATIFLASAATAAVIRRPEASSGRTALASTFAIIGLVMIIRIVIALSGIHSGAPPGYTTWSRGLLFVISSIGPVVGTLAFVLMCADQVGENLLRFANIDSLTGILNRRSFFEETERALSTCRRRKEPLAFLAMDLDHFKAVNDTKGHPEGDRALIKVAGILQGALRTGDLIGRMGGEEFGVASPGTNADAAIVMAERIRKLLENKDPLIVPGIPLTLSVGVAVTSDSSETLESLIQRADNAMYEAKRSGRNRVCLAP